MLDPQTLARPYAKACFDDAVETQTIEQWFEFLQMSAQAISLPNIVEWVAAPVAVNERCQVWQAVIGDSMAEAQHNFIALLAEKKRLALLEPIFQEFEQMKLVSESACKVEVLSTQLLQASDMQRFQEGLQKRLGLSVTLKNTVDPSILGGAVIHSGDMVMDYSIRGKLQQLSEHLLESA